MRDNVSDIAAYYNSDPEREDTRLDRHQLEFDLTWRYLHRYLPPSGHILEVGAATGRYTRALARRGYTITAVDMSGDLLAFNRRRIIEEGCGDQVQFVLADARELFLPGAVQYDAVLLMGPLYHLVHAADRRLALRQAWERLRPGGPLFSAFINRYGILGDLMRDLTHWIEDGEMVEAILTNGSRPPGAPAGGFRGYFATAGEIVPLHEGAGFETVTLAAVEPAISADDEAYNRLQGEQRRRWLDLLERISTVPSLLDASRHLLYVGRRPAAAAA